MIKKIIYFLLFFFTSILNAQTTKDSLLLKLKKHPKPDFKRCEILDNIIKNNIEDNVEQTITFKFLNELKFICDLNLKNKQNKNKIYQKFLGSFYYQNGYFAYLNFDNEKAIILLNKALALHFESKAILEIANDLNYIGIVNFTDGKYKESQNFYIKSAKYYRLAKNTSGYLNVMYNLSEIFLKLSRFEEASNTLILALKIAEKDKDYQSVADIYDSLADVYLKQQDYEKLAFYCLKGLALKRKINNTNSLATSYRYLGIVYCKKKDYPKSINFLDEAFKYTKNKLQEAAVHTTKGMLLFEMGKYNDSEKSLLQALSINKSEGLKSSIYPILSELYLKINNLILAEKYGINGFDLSKANGYIEKQFQASNNLYLVYKKKNQLKESFKYLEIATTLKDSINRKENQNTTLKADFKYQSEKKEATIKELNQKKKITELESNKKSILLNSVLISVLALGLIGYFLFSRYKNQKKNELLQTQLTEAKKLLEAEKKATDSELKALKSQMNPHFIFNALNSIQEQFMYGDKIKANLQLSNFTYLTRQILEVSGKKNIPIATEIDILTKYLELEKMRFAKDFEYTITIAENLDEDYVKLPPMLIQPFVENSVKHGLLHKNGLKTVAISFDINPSEEFLICSIIDNGIGREKSAEIKANSIQNHSSFSTKSIQQRLDLLNENLQLTDLILYSDITENEVVCGTKVVVKIPLV